MMSVGAAVLIASVGLATVVPAGAAAKKSVIKLGIIAPENTAVFNLPESVAGVAAAVNAVNASGGIGGHKVSMVYCNDEGDPNQTTACAREMISQKVLAVVGGGASFGNLISPILLKAHIAWIGDDAVSSPEFNDSNMFLFSGGALGSYAILAAADGQTKTNTAAVAVDFPGVSGLLSSESSVAASAGQGFSTQTLVDPTAADLSPTIAAMNLTSAKAVFMQVGSSQAAQIIAAAKTAGFNPVFQYATEPVAEEISALGTSTYEFASPFPLLIPNSPNKLVALYMKQLHKLASTGNEAAIASYATPSQTGIEGWLGVQVIQTLVKTKALKTLTAKALLVEMNKVKNINLDGIIPAWTPGLKGPTGQVRLSNQNYYISTFASGKFTQITKNPVTVGAIVSGKVKIG
jgi:ABC-type branched-subunit amino acid transport system substrate-binding protein